MTIIPSKPYHFDYTQQDRWGNDAPPATGAPDWLPETTNWKVRVASSDGVTMMDIQMGSTNIGAWVNTAAGAEIARAAIVAAMP